MSDCRVLHVLDHSLPLQSGYVFRTLALLRAQRDLGWQTAHLTGPKQGGGGGEEVVEGWRFYRTQPPWGRLGRWPLLDQLAVIRGLGQRILEVAARERPQVIHAHSPALNGVAAVWAGRRLGLPVVYEVRAFWEDAAVSHGTAVEGNLRYRATRGLEGWVFRRADQVVAICQGLAGEIARRGVARERITVVRNGVAPVAPPDPERLRALARHWALDGGEVVAFMGSFYHYEGLDLLLEAWPGVLARRPRAVLLLAGGGPEEAALRRLAEQLGIMDRIRFTGRLARDQVDELQHLADLFVFPRRRIRLTELVTPLKPLEAMAAGKPVLASDVGGHREWVREGESGFLFPAGEVAAMTREIVRRLSDAGESLRVAAQARRWVSRELTWAGEVEQYRRVYARALREKG